MCTVKRNVQISVDILYNVDFDVVVSIIAVVGAEDSVVLVEVVFLKI